MRQFEDLRYDLQMIQRITERPSPAPMSFWGKATMVLWGLIFLTAPVYAFYSRGVSALKYVTISAVILFGIQAVQIRVSRRVAISPLMKDSQGIAYATAAITSFFISTIIYGLGAALLDGFEKLPVTPSFWTLAGIGAVTLVIGLFCFWVRGTNRVLWGVTEVGVGVGLPVYRAGEMTLESLNADFAIFALTAGVYLIVRGLDNMSQGRKEAIAKAKEREGVLRSF